jgi:cell division septation protein DedD
VRGARAEVRAVRSDPASKTTPAPPQRPRPPASARSLALQVGAFRDPANAAALRRELGRHFAVVTVTSVERDGQTLHRVRVEGLPTEGALQTALSSLRKAGHHPFPVTPTNR